MAPETGENVDVIATSFYPVYIFTANLVEGIEGVEVRCIAQQSTGCLHDYTLTARDARLLSDATVLVINGAGMETFMEDLSESVAELPVIDSSLGIELICSHGHEENDTEEHSHHHENNSHVWLSVENAKKQVTNIKDGLVEIYPQFESQITDNYDAYMGRLNELGVELESAYKTASGEKVITFHAAYEYLAAESGIEVVECIESDEGGEPSAKELTHLCRIINENQIKALFIEPNYSGSAADILANETGAKVYILNPVTSGEATLTAYEDIMRENIQIILKAVS